MFWEVTSYIKKRKGTMSSIYRNEQISVSDWNIVMMMM